MRKRTADNKQPKMGKPKPSFISVLFSETNYDVIIFPIWQKKQLKMNLKQNEQRMLNLHEIQNKNED